MAENKLLFSVMHSGLGQLIAEGLPPDQDFYYQVVVSAQQIIAIIITTVTCT